MNDLHLFIFAMYYDFMSYVAQQLGGDLETGAKLNEGQKKLMDVIIKCDKEFRYSNWMVSNGMIAIVKVSYPEPKYIKDIESYYQVQRSVTWSDYTSNKKNLSAIRYKELLVQHMTTNDSDTFIDPVASHLRRGANAIQGLISSSKRKRNRVQIFPLGLQMVNEMDSSSDDHTEGSESASPAFHPTSPPYSVETTESLGKARTQGPGTTLEFTPVQEPEPAVDSDSKERTDLSMFSAPVAMKSAQIAHSN